MGLGLSPMVKPLFTIGPPAPPGNGGLIKVDIVDELLLWVPRTS